MTEETQLLELAVPAVPEVSAQVLQNWYTVHEHTTERVANLGEHLSWALRDYRLDRCLEGLAGITPSISGESDPPLFPAPRRFLSPFNIERLAGCRAAIDHVNVRLALIDDGLERTLIRSETPFILHALIEGRPTSDEITNPGILRVHESGWQVRQHVFRPPPAEMARPLLDLVVETVVDRPASPPTLGAWTVFTLLSIHPFVDGNGRTARVLYLLIASLALQELDLGTLEAIALRRPDYLAALQGGQWTTPVWNPELLDPRPFIAATYNWSAWGARRHASQAAALEAVDDELRRRFSGLTDAGLATIVRSALNRGISADPAGRWTTDGLESLVEAGLLHRHGLPASARQGRQPVLVYSPTKPITDALRTVASTRVGQS